MNYFKDQIEKVIAICVSYLKPDGISSDKAISKILGVVDTPERVKRLKEEPKPMARQYLNPEEIYTGRRIYHEDYLNKMTIGRGFDCGITFEQAHKDAGLGKIYIYPIQ